MSRGTPNTLNKAIQNAFTDYKKEGVVSEARLRKILISHLRDFLRNSLSPAYILADDNKVVLKALDRAIKSYGR